MGRAAASCRGLHRSARQSTNNDVALPLAEVWNRASPVTLFPAVWLALGSRTQGSAHPVKVERAWQSLAVDICALRILAHQRKSLVRGDWVAPGNTTPRFHLAPEPPGLMSEPCVVAPWFRSAAFFDSGRGRARASWARSRLSGPAAPSLRPGLHDCRLLRFPVQPRFLTAGISDIVLHNRGIRNTRGASGPGDVCGLGFDVFCSGNNNGMEGQCESRAHAQPEQPQTKPRRGDGGGLPHSYSGESLRRLCDAAVAAQPLPTIRWCSKYARAFVHRPCCCTEDSRPQDFA